MDDLEAQRNENVRRKQELLQELNLRSLNHDRPSASKLLVPQERKITAKRRHVPDVTPSRSSARIASSLSSKPSYAENEYNNGEDPDVDAKRVRTSSGQRRHKKPVPKSRPPSSASPITFSPTAAPSLPQTQIDSIVRGWSLWKPTAPPPTRDENGYFHFPSHPSFTPNKSPEEILRQGCFGGSYFRPLVSRKLGNSTVIRDDYKELPTAWIDGLDVSRYLTSTVYDADVNKFKVSCGQSIEEWEAAGWINHDHDVRGWFQWYCRFFQGRRLSPPGETEDDGGGGSRSSGPDEDERQVSRWRKCVGHPGGRWRRMLLKKYVALGVREVFDDGADEEEVEVSPVMHQTCHHWAFEVTQHVLDDFWAQPAGP